MGRERNDKLSELLKLPINTLGTEVREGPIKKEDVNLLKPRITLPQRILSLSKAGEIRERGRGSRGSRCSRAGEHSRDRCPSGSVRCRKKNGRTDFTKRSEEPVGSNRFKTPIPKELIKKVA